MSEYGSPRTCSVFSFFLVLGFLLAQSTAALPRFQKNTGLPVLAFQRVYLTQLRDGDPSRTGLPVLVLATVEDVMGGEVDKLEEDLG